MWTQVVVWCGVFGGRRGYVLAEGLVEGRREREVVGEEEEGEEKKNQ